jgi:hypothetical protein
MLDLVEQIEFGRSIGLFSYTAALTPPNPSLDGAHCGLRSTRTGCAATGVHPGRALHVARLNLALRRDSPSGIERATNQSGWRARETS